METMKISSGTVVLFLFIIDSEIKSAAPVKIEFFGKEDFQGLLHIANYADTCTNIPSELEDKVLGSVKTDVCLSLYKGPNCTAGILWTGPGVIRQLAWYVESNIRLEYPINSYKACNGSGGQPIDLDFYGKEDTKGPIILKVRQFNGCMNLPESLTKLTLSVNNRGNGFYAWGGTNCTYPMKVVPGGAGGDAYNLNINHKDYSFQGNGKTYDRVNVKSISAQ